MTIRACCLRGLESEFNGAFLFFASKHRLQILVVAVEEVVYVYS